VADVLTGQATIEDHHVLDELAEYERDVFQADAVAAVLERFKAGADRCQGYAPTGAGKTHIAAAIWDGLKLPPDSIMVMVSPTRSVAQAAGKFRDYCRPTIPPARTLQVTSDPGGATDPAEIAAFLADDNAPRMVFVTDKSLPRVTKALVKLGLVADLFIVDEAHRNTAVRLADVKAFWAEEAVTNVPAARRFFITATPRSGAVLRTGQGRVLDMTSGAGRGRKIISQDNAELFGPVAFDLPFDEAVTRGIVLPVAAYTLGTTDGELAKSLNRAGVEQIWQGERMDYREIAAHLAIYKAVTDGLPSPEGTEGEPYRPQRIMATFDRASQARAFVRRHTVVMDALGLPGAKAFLYIGRTPAVDRQAAYRRVQDLTYGDHRLSHAVIAQCGALVESFDLPDLDMALLASNDKSTVTIQQTIGRITRLPVRSSKRWASVVTTDVSPDDLDELPFYSVMRALTGMSESLRHDLYDDRSTDGLGGTPPVRLGTLDGKPLPEDFAERVRLALVPARRDDWIPAFIDHLRDFKAQFGHVEVDSGYVSPDGYRLGARVYTVRIDYGDTPLRANVGLM
jgi:superfamily II DNA or RNA helicase